LTTHDIEDIEELCSRIIIIDEGKKIYDGSLAELKDKYGTKGTVAMNFFSSDRRKTTAGCIRRAIGRCHTCSPFSDERGFDRRRITYSIVLCFRHCRHPDLYFDQARRL